MIYIWLELQWWLIFIINVLVVIFMITFIYCKYFLCSIFKIFSSPCVLNCIFSLTRRNIVNRHSYIKREINGVFSSKNCFFIDRVTSHNIYMEEKKTCSIGTAPKFNIKIVERGKNQHPLTRRYKNSWNVSH